MISYLYGDILDLDFARLTLMTSSWVWYDVAISDMTYASLSVGQEIKMPIYHHIAEWHQALFGFWDISEKQIFAELIKISGIGWKVALQMLSLWASRLIHAVQSWDNTTIESIKWIGKKMAEKVILELKDKPFHNIVVPSSSQTSVSSSFADVVSTLVNMWYDKNDVEKTLSWLPKDMTDIGEIIPYVIKHI